MVLSQLIQYRLLSIQQRYSNRLARFVISYLCLLVEIDEFRWVVIGLATKNGGRMPPLCSGGFQPPTN